MAHDLASIASHFALAGGPPSVTPVMTGHINDTYVLTATCGGQVIRHVLQRINHRVFTDPPAVMANIVRVTEHIREEVTRSDPALAARQVRVVPAKDGQSYYQDAAGDFWRVYGYIEDAVTFDTIESEALACEAARMFGSFQGVLRDLPGPALHETIPHFHDTARYLDRFRQTVEKDAMNRAKRAAAEIDFVLENAAICHVLSDLSGKGALPVRVVHNDAKINNVMLDRRTGSGVCLIDLDTVMPGLSVHDFGDLVRTATCPAPEDERDLSKVDVDIRLFRALVQGFAETTRSWLTSRERQRLVFGAKLITFEQMIRFLTDYLAGDIYYRVHRREQNLDRSRTQAKLVQSIIRQEERLARVVEEAFGNTCPGGVS